MSRGRVEFVGEWGSGTDDLNGKTLEHGERLLIEWPDGTSEHVIVTVRVTGGTVSDHGHVYPTSTWQSYVVVDHHGASVEVPLRGLKARRM